MEGKILTGDVRSTVAQQHHQMNCPLQRHERNCDAATHVNQMLLGIELESVNAIWMETSERKITKVTGTTAHAAPHGSTDVRSSLWPAIDIGGEEC